MATNVTPINKMILNDVVLLLSTLQSSNLLMFGKIKIILENESHLLFSSTNLLISGRRDAVCSDDEKKYVKAIFVLPKATYNLYIESKLTRSTKSSFCRQHCIMSQRSLCSLAFASKSLGTYQIDFYIN